MKILKEKADLKNDDEFYFQMENAHLDKFEDLVIHQKEGNLSNKQDFMNILKTRNENVLKMQIAKIKKKIGKLKELY